MSQTLAQTAVAGKLNFAQTRVKPRQQLGVELAPNLYPMAQIQETLS